MVMLKTITGHTKTGALQRYLEKDGRALAFRFLNIAGDLYLDNTKELIEGGGIPWAKEMDDTRALFGNDRAKGTGRLRTYKHYIISPDPKDNISLDDLDCLCRAWAYEFFKDYEVAIVYHSDNKNKIPHAHVVVNNTNLKTGKKLHIDKPHTLNWELQEIAKRQHLTAFSNDFKPGYKAPNKWDNNIKKGRSRSISSLKIEETRGYSWVEDIKRRVSVAKSLAKDAQDFLDICSSFGVNVTNNSPNAKTPDWLYSLEDRPTYKISGEKLGTWFAKDDILSTMRHSSPLISRKEPIQRQAQKAIELKDTAELTQLFKTLITINNFRIRCIADIDRNIDAVNRFNWHADTEEEKTESIKNLTSAKEYLLEKDILPKQIIRAPLTPKHEDSNQRHTQPPVEETYTPHHSHYIERNIERGRCI